MECLREKVLSGRLSSIFCGRDKVDSISFKESFMLKSEVMLSRLLLKADFTGVSLGDICWMLLLSPLQSMGTLR